MVVEHLASHRDGEVTVGLFDEQRVAELVGSAPVGELIFVATETFQLACVGVEVTGLTEKIEADVGQCHVLFEFGCMREPLGQSMAQDEGPVGVTKDMGEQIGGHGQVTSGRRQGAVRSW